MIKHSFRKILGLAIFAALIMASCQKTDTDTPLPYGTVDAFMATKGAQSQSFSFDPTSVQVITGAAGTKFTFPANTFKRPDGQLAVGNVSIELKEIYDKSDMIWANKPTESYGSLLESGGEFFIKATDSDGEELYAQNSIEMNAPLANTSVGNPSAMSFFFGTPNGQDTTFTWVPADTSTTTWTDTSGINGNPPNYTVYFDSLGWINCDYYWNTSAPRINIAANRDATDATLTSVKAYLVFSSISSVLRGWPDSFTNPTRFEFNNIPTGQSATIVLIGMDGTQFYYGSLPITVSSSGSPYTVTMTPTTEAAMTAAINAL